MKAKKKQELKHKEELDWKARVAHAHTQVYLHRYEDAEEEYRKLLEKDPHATHVKIDLATLFYYQKKYSEALDLLKTIPDQEKSDKQLILTADIYLSKSDYQKAETLYLEYLNKHPNDQSAIIKLAKLFSWEKKYGMAIELYRNFLIKHPQNVQVRRQYARVLMWMGKQEEAVEEFRKTLSEDDENDSGIQSKKTGL